MPNQYVIEDFNLNGQIVEIYEKDGLKFLKVSIKCDLFDVQIDEISDFHLKDEIQISSKILIENIQLQKPSFD